MWQLAVKGNVCLLTGRNGTDRNSTKKGEKRLLRRLSP